MVKTEKKRKLSPWWLKIFVWLLLFGAILPTVQSQDSLFYAREAVWKERQAQVQYWKQIQDTFSVTLDSIKENTLSEGFALDSAALGSTLIFLDTEKKRISGHIRAIKTAQTTWLPEPPQRQLEEDSMVLDDSLETDTTERIGETLRIGEALLDTLPQLIQGFERLVGDVVSLEKLLDTQQTENVVATIDSNTVDTAAIESGRRNMVSVVQRNLGRDGAVSEFFHYSEWSRRIFLIVVSLFYFYWIYKLGRKPEEDEEKLPVSRPEPIWIPILKTCIFFLVLLPFASFSVPALIVQGSYLLVVVFLYVLLYRRLSPFRRNVLGLVFLSYVILVCANLFLSVAWWSKVLVILANAIGIAVVWFTGRRIAVDNSIGYIHRYIGWLVIIGYLIAIVWAVMGSISLSRIWSLAAGIALLQVITLRGVRKMLLRDIEYQYHVSKPDALFRRFDLQRMLQSADRFFHFCSVALIVIVLLNNFHLMQEAAAFAERVLFTPQRIGGITFAYGNLLLAIAVLWLANWLQQNLKNLLDDTPSKGELQVRKMTLFPLFRLLIIVIGFLVGISILGVGVDKLTVIIGALSVGIGLGLQNIINNFVSGVILVFEKPFKIGDYVELADKKGQVMEIGIRSSTLLTDEGARVIIPNGDLLSGRLVNWTFKEADIRLNLKLTVDNTVPIEEIKGKLKANLRSFEEIDPSVPLKIFTKEITADNYELTIQVGVRHVRYIERFRSRFLETFKKEMDDRGVKVSSG